MQLYCYAILASFFFLFGCSKKQEPGPSALEASKELETQASQGDTDAQFSLGMMYYHGAEELKQDYVKAYAYLQLASKEPSIKELAPVQEALTDLGNSLNSEQKKNAQELISKIQK